MINNYMSPLEFVVTVKRLPHVQFFTQRVSIPGININPVEQPTPFKPLMETGDKVTYGDLNLSFIIDEKMSNWIEVHNWITGIGFPEEFDQFADLKQSKEGIRSDSSIILMNSNKNPNIEIYFKDCFPTNLSEIQLDTTQNDLIYPEATVTFAHNGYRINVL